MPRCGLCNLTSRFASQEIAVCAICLNTKPDDVLPCSGYDRIHNHPLLSMSRLLMIGLREMDGKRIAPLPEGAGMKPLDTTLEAEKIQLDIFRRMGPERRLEAGLSLSRTCRELLREGVRRRHPDYDERQVRLAVIRLTLPDDLFSAAYPEARDVLP